MIKIRTLVMIFLLLSLSECISAEADSTKAKKPNTWSTNRQKKPDVPLEIAKDVKLPRFDVHFGSFDILGAYLGFRALVGQQSSIDAGVLFLYIPYGEICGVSIGYNYHLYALRNIAFKGSIFMPFLRYDGEFYPVMPGFDICWLKIREDGFHFNASIGCMVSYNKHKLNNMLGIPKLMFEGSYCF